MGQWFKKKPQEIIVKTEPTFEFNREKLKKEMGLNWTELYALREQDSYKILLRQVELAWQTEVLDTAGLAPEVAAQAHAYRRGRMQAFKDLLESVVLAFEQQKVTEQTKGEETVPRIKMIQRSTAKPAI